jgi:hypothetical protein
MVINLTTVPVTSNYLKNHALGNAQLAQLDPQGPINASSTLNAPMRLDGRPVEMIASRKQH